MSYGEGEEHSASELDPGEHGELWLRSPSCIAAYYRNDEATGEAFREDGWYRTGDIGFFKDEKLFLVDRKKVCIDLPEAISKLLIFSRISSRLRTTFLRRILSVS